MTDKIKSVGLVSRLDIKEALELSSKIADYMKERGLEVLVQTELAEKIGFKGKFLPIEELNVDLVIVVGGDGTILRTCLSLPKPEPPLLTVNMGERGFLAEVKPKEVFQALDKCLKGEFILEKHTKLAAYINDKQIPDALNEVFITTGTPVKLMYARIWKDRNYVGECQADGVIVASQVGSTGYSLSAGGPVLDNEMEAFVVTPVCPLIPFHPIVFPKNSTITIDVRRPRKISVIVDGHYQEVVESDNPKISIKISNNQTRFIRFKEDFYQRLRSRLLYPGGKS
ncbi:NAD(+)/NADH kinase [Candidatus Bathyarchaeota archaeon]|nr:NAD(+)/NADH kinase [Candidatus Bathyarchaeota archaeon]